MDVFIRGAVAIRLLSLALGLAMAVPSVAVAKPWYIREQRTVWVNGHREVWQLRWRERPSTAFVGPWDGSFHPEHEGNFQYAEAGDIDLLRLRRGKIVDRLNLTQFFPIDDGETFPVALIPRWPIVLTEKNEEYYTRHPREFSRIVKSRRPVVVMQLHDYNGDGHSTEFVLQVQALNSFVWPSILVGLDIRQDKLRSFNMIDKPDKPLPLRAPEVWEEVRRQTRITPLYAQFYNFECGYPSYEEEKVTIQFEKAGIRIQEWTNIRCSEKSKDMPSP